MPNTHLPEWTKRLNASQRACLTQTSKTGERDMKNRKPFRTTEQRLDARGSAVKVNGRFISTAKRSFH